MEQNIANDKNETIKFLFEKHSERVFACVLAMTGSVEEARDIVSETFLKALNEPAILSPNFNARAWLFKVAINQARNSITRFFKRWLSFSNEDMDLFAANKIDACDCILKAEEFRELSKALRTLDEKDRQVIYLKYYEEMSYGEISEIVGIPEGTVGSRLSRAIGRLSDELGKR